MDYIPPELDAGSARAIQGIYDRAHETTADQIARATTDKIESASGLINPSKAEKSIALAKFSSPGDDYLLDALNRRASRSYESALKEIGVNAKHQAQAALTERKAKAASLLSKQQAYNEQIRAMRLKAEQDRKAARAQAIGAILGIGGAAAGAYFGGAPGAAAGYGIGSGAGQLAAGGGRG